MPREPASIRGQQLWIVRDEGGSYLREEWRKRDYDTLKRPWFMGAMALASDEDVHWTEPYQFFTTKDVGVTASMRWTDRNDGRRFVAKSGRQAWLLEVRSGAEHGLRAIQADGLDASDTKMIKQRKNILGRLPK